MKKRIAACLLALLLLCMTGCEKISKMMNTGGASAWINSDMKESYENVGEIRLQDDFAAAINRDWVVSQEGEAGGTLNSIMETVDEREKEILSDPTLQDRDALELKKFAEFAMDWDCRNSQGIEPLRRYIESIQSISSKEDAYRWICDPESNPLFLAPLILRDYGKDYESEDQYMVLMHYPKLSLTTDDGKEDAYTSMEMSSHKRKLYVDSITEYMLSRLGYTGQDIRKIQKQGYLFEKKLYDAQGRLQLKPDGPKYTMDDIIQEAGGYPFSDYWQSHGFAVPKIFRVNMEYIKRIDGICNDVEGFKSMMMVQYLLYLTEFLDADTLAASDDANALTMTDQEIKDKELKDKVEQKEDRLLTAYLNNTCMIDIMGKYYVQKYYTDQDRERLTKLTEDLIGAMREDIASLDWISEEGKAAATEKLDNMCYHVIMPDYDHVDYSDIRIVSKEDGGSFLDAFIQTYQHKMRFQALQASKKFDRSLWNPDTMSTMNVNAGYSPSYNSIFICAGILADPIYDPSMSDEELLANIGTVIGHEITHGFDSDGMTYDKYGNNQLFMPTEDQQAFNRRASQASLFLTMLQPLPGAGPYSGQQVVGEMIADMAGVKLCLLIAEKKENFDYDLFFREFTSHWARSVSREMEETYFRGDVHPLNFLRANITLQQYEKFYETYGIREGDHMYAAPDKRIAIW